MKQSDKFKIREILDLLIEFVYLATVFLIPLYFSFFFTAYNIFELSKSSLFRILVWLLFFLTVSKILLYPSSKIFNYFRHKNFLANAKKYYLIPFIFIVGLGFSLIFSSNFALSFYGSYDRQAGYLNFLFYFLWFILLVYNIKTINNRISLNSPKDTIRKRINRLLIVVVISSFLVALYGILQILGIDFLSWPEDPLFTRRTISTFGQPNFLASWLLLVIPLSVYFIIEKKKLILKFLFFLVLLAELSCLFFTASRGGIVALGVSIIAFIIYLIFFLNLNKSRKMIIIFSLLLLLFSSIWGINRFLPGRFSGLFDLQKGSMAARVNFYGAAVDAIKVHPLFGYGIENSSEVFISYYQSDWGIYGDVGATTDKAHNIILDIILATGFFGLIIFTILYYYFFKLSFENIRRRKDLNLSLALGLGVLAYLSSLLFSFAIVGGEIYFWLFLAIIVLLNNDFETTEDLDFKSAGAEIRNVYQVVAKAIIFLIFSALAVWGINYEFRAMIADHYFNDLYYALAEEQYFTVFTLNNYLDAEKPNPVAQNYYERFLAYKLSDFYPPIFVVTEKRATRDKLIELDGKLAAQGYENLFVKGKINSVLGNYSRAEGYFLQVAAETPHWPKTYIELGKTYAREKKTKEAIINYNLALANLPDINDERLEGSHKKVVSLYLKTIYSALADIYFSSDNYAEAEKYYQKAYTADVNDSSLLKKIADTYYKRNNLEKALEYNIRGAKRNPDDYNWFLAIATVYKESGNKKLASEYLEQAIKLAPDQDWLLKLRSEY